MTCPLIVIPARADSSRRLANLPPESTRMSRNTYTFTASKGHKDSRNKSVLTRSIVTRHRPQVSLELPSAEAVLVLGHVHATAAKTHALQFQPRALFQAGFVFQLDGAAGAHHALPRQPVPLLAQQLRHLPVKQRVPGGGRHLAV